MSGSVRKLSQLPLGNRGIVSHLTADGPVRRRLLDLGLVEGAKVEVIRRSLAGDPTAYLIKGAVIALRKEEADHVYIK